MNLASLLDPANFFALIQILLIDLALAGDNAVIIGMAAAGLDKEQRHKAVIAGILAATVLRIIFAIFAIQLLAITGLMLAGGLLLLWVAWKMFQEIRHMQKMHDAKTRKDGEAEASTKPPAKKLSAAIWQIVIADISMSLDNVLAVAGAARDHIGMLVIGLAISVLLMGFASSLVARLVARFQWIGMLGLAVVLYTSLHMIWDGAKPFM